MFFIFKILPNWIWYLLPALGLLGFFLSYLPQLKTYDFILKIVACTTITIGIFILGMLYCDNTWNLAAAELQAKVIEMQAKSQSLNETIKEKVIVKTQTIKTRGDDIVKYVDREVVKYDGTCVIPKEFVEVHNRAAEPPK
jgi:hypothetical protein